MLGAFSRLNALQLTLRRPVERRSSLPVAQTILGLAALGCGYYLALSVKDPHPHCACDLLSSRYPGHDWDLPAI